MKTEREKASRKRATPDPVSEASLRKSELRTKS